MRPLEIRIAGSFYDSQIYSGELYLWTTTGAIVRVRLNKLVDSVEKKDQYRAPSNSPSAGANTFTIQMSRICFTIPRSAQFWNGASVHCLSRRSKCHLVCWRDVLSRNMTTVLDFLMPIRDSTTEISLSADKTAWNTRGQGTMTMRCSPLS